MTRDSGHATLRTPEHQRAAAHFAGLSNKKNKAGIFSMTLEEKQAVGSRVAKMVNCKRWRVNKGLPCICGMHPGFLPPNSF
jgi:hypothetical protein